MRRAKIRVYLLSIPSRSLGRRSKTHPLIIPLLSLNDLGKDADANKIDLPPISLLSLRRKGEREASDGRILGGGKFVERMVEEAEERMKETLRWRKRVMDLKTLLKEVAKREGLEEEEVKGRSRRESVVRGRKVFCQVAVRRLGYTGASVARFLGMTRSSVNRMARLEEMTELDAWDK